MPARFRHCSGLCERAARRVKSAGGPDYDREGGAARGRVDDESFRRRARREAAPGARFGAVARAWDLATSAALHGERFGCSVVVRRCGGRLRCAWRCGEGHAGIEEPGIVCLMPAGIGTIGRPPPGGCETPLDARAQDGSATQARRKAVRPPVARPPRDGVRRPDIRYSCRVQVRADLRVWRTTATTPERSGCVTQTRPRADMLGLRHRLGDSHDAKGPAASSELFPTSGRAMVMARARRSGLELPGNACAVASRNRSSRCGHRC